MSESKRYVNEIGGSVSRMNVEKMGANRCTYKKVRSSFMEEKENRAKQVRQKRLEKQKATAITGVAF